MEFFDIVGSFGRWQLKIFLVLFFVNILGMWQNLSIVFQTPNMDFHCVQPSSEGYYSNGSTLAYDDRCEVPREENSTILVPCSSWKYDTSYTSQTIVSEWDLVCSREWLISLAKSIYMIGFLFSVLIFGQISDLIGRFPTIVISYCIMLVSSFLSLLSNSISMFIATRFFQAFGRSAMTTTGYVLIREIVGPQHQTVIGLTIQIGWSIGFTTIAGIAWLFPHWFFLQLVIALSVVPIALAYGMIPESPRWLLTRGKTKKLERLVNKAAGINGRKVNEEEIKGLKFLNTIYEKEDGHYPTLLEVLKMTNMRKRLLIMIYVWIVNAFLYFAISYSIGDLAGNIYLNFFIAGLVEFPSFAFIFWGIKIWGRRPTLVSFMVMGGVSCAAILLVPADMPWLITTFSLVGKFCVTGSFRLLYIYIAELFPTSVRNVTLGSCSMCARIGSILAPFIRDLGKATHAAVPNSLNAFLALTAGLLALLLPETRGLDLPDTLQEGENLGEDTSKLGKNTTDLEVVSLKA